MSSPPVPMARPTRWVLLWTTLSYRLEDHLEVLSLPHFTDEEIKAHRHCVIFPSSHSC